MGFGPRPKKAQEQEDVLGSATEESDEDTDLEGILEASEDEDAEGKKKDPENVEDAATGEQGEKNDGKEENDEEEEGGNFVQVDEAFEAEAETQLTICVGDIIEVVPGEGTEEWGIGTVVSRDGNVLEPALGPGYFPVAMTSPW